jgi:hypothetical protein
MLIRTCNGNSTVITTSKIQCAAVTNYTKESEKIKAISIYFESHVSPSVV